MDVIKTALKYGADDAIAEKIIDSTTQIRFANNSVTAVQNWATERYEVFVAVKRATAFTTVNNAENLEAAAKHLVESAKRSKPSEDYTGIAKGPFKYKPLKNGYDKNLIDFDCVDAVDAAINAALENSKTAAGVLYRHVVKRSLRTSGGVDTGGRKTQIRLSIRAFNDKNESGHAVSCSRILKKFDPVAAGRKAGEIAKLSKDPVQGSAGKFDIVFDPLAIGNLLCRVGEFATVFSVDSGFSCFGGKLGKRIASPLTNISDDGHMENGLNSSEYDDEGVPTRETKFIEKGILKTYLHNTSSAKKYKTKTTGNAGIVAQKFYNILMKPGKQSKEKVFSSVKKGLYINNVWYTRFHNYYAGDFSTIPRDGILLIENGEIKKPLSNIRISDNILRMLANIAAVSNKAEWVQWWDEINPPVYTPYVLVKDVNITLPTM